MLTHELVRALLELKTDKARGRARDLVDVFENVLLLARDNGAC